MLASPQTYSAELVPLTAEPSGAGFSWMGVGFFLGILDPGKALATPRGGRPLLLPPSELPRARRAGPNQGCGPGGCLRGTRSARSRQGRVASGGLRRPPSHLLGSEGTEGLPHRRSTAAPGFPPALPQSTGPQGLRGPAARAPQRCSSHSPEKCAAATAAFQATRRSSPRGPGGRGRGGEG